MFDTDEWISRLQLGEVGSMHRFVVSFFQTVWVPNHNYKLEEKFILSVRQLYIEDHCKTPLSASILRHIHFPGVYNPTVLTLCARFWETDKEPFSPLQIEKWFKKTKRREHIKKGPFCSIFSEGTVSSRWFFLGLAMFEPHRSVKHFPMWRLVTSTIEKLQAQQGVQILASPGMEHEMVGGMLFQCLRVWSEF